jgi:glycosyltransferase involved in cell wall biosynthesis
MQNHLPKISVIVPSFNQGTFIEETFRSLLSQEYPLLEIIVIDGGSTDNSVEIIKQYEAQLAFWISEKDSGQSEAINKGFRKATGEIITWLNSDDCYEPGTLQLIGKLFAEQPGVSIVHGKSVLFGEGMKDKVIGLDQDIPRHEYFAFMRFPQPSSFFRKDALLQALPVNEALHYAMDFDLVVRMLLNGSGIKRVPEILSRYRLHASSKSNNQLAFLREWTAIVAKFFSAVKGGEVYKKRLTELQLLASMPLTDYKTTLSFSTDELERIFLLHLNLCYHTFYQACDKNACRRISAYLKNHAPDFYEKNNYKTYDLRLKFIPDFVFKWLRSA